MTKRLLKSHSYFPPNVRNIHLEISFYVIHIVLNTNLTKGHASHPFHFSPEKSSRFTLKVSRDKLDQLFGHEDSCGTESLRWNSVRQHEGTINLYETVAGTQPCDSFAVVEMMSLSDGGDVLCTNLHKWQRSLCRRTITIETGESMKL